LFLLYVGQVLETSKPILRTQGRKIKKTLYLKHAENRTYTQLKNQNVFFSFIVIQVLYSNLTLAFARKYTAPPGELDKT